MEKEIVQELQCKGFSEGQFHQEVFRPWGSYTSIANEKRWQVKLIKVKPRESLSLQRHKHRSEHWTIVQGIAEVRIDNKTLELESNESIHIPKNSKHSIANNYTKDLIIIEVWYGDNLSEDDIERYEDIYGRV